jgi:serine/threonine protein phosphatase 1
MSDSHGGYRAMVQCLERCGFNSEIDQLFYLGDVVDGWSETKDSIDLLMGIGNLVYILGNHDQWALRYYTGALLEGTDEYRSWQHHGGLATRASYGFQTMIPEHMEFLTNASLYHVTEDGLLFVHAGLDTTLSIENNDPDTLLWDRSLVNGVTQLHRNKQPVLIEAYREVFVGHSPTLRLGHQIPLTMGNFNMVDTGAAFTGRLSIMDVDTKEVFQSDRLQVLYPDEDGRNGYSWNGNTNIAGY